MICSLILIDPQRLRLPMSERGRYERMVTRSSWGSLSRPGREGEEARQAPGPGLGLGETNERPGVPVPIGLCSKSLDIDRVSILRARFLII